MQTKAIILCALSLAAGACAAAGAEAAPSPAATNAVAQAARFGTALEGCTAYVTCQPCAMCMKSLMQAGCVRVVWSGDGYPDALGLQLAAEAGWVMRGTNELEKAR